ncbi:MAG: class I SAM-dependent methyltransferase [Candidatus Helarchaeota archaeon]
MTKNIENLKEYFNFDIYADIYDKTRDVSSSFQSLIFLLFNKAGFRKSERPLILEIGIGTGMALKFLSKTRKLFPIYIGIDISLKMLKKVIKKYNTHRIHLILADAYWLPFKPNIFDMTLLIRTIHLLSKWKQCLKEIKSCIKDQKMLIIVTGGPGIKILNKCPSNEKYLELRKKFGYPLFYFGADWAEIPSFIKNELHAELEVIQGSYSITKELKKVLYEFENQLMTWHTQVPKPVHDSIVSELKKFLLNYYGTLDYVEKQEGYYTIGFVKF